MRSVDLTIKMAFDAPAVPYNSNDPHASFLASSCLDLLLIELVPMAYRMANELNGDSRPPSELELRSSRKDKKAQDEEKDGRQPTGDRSGDRSGENGRSRLDEEEEREAVFFRLDSLGYRVGQGLVER